MNHREGRELKLPPAIDEALAKLTELFSDPNLPSKAQFRCGTEGPTEFDVLFESIIDDQFGYNPNSEYKNWVRSLYRLGLIPRIPSEWEVPETPVVYERIERVIVERPPQPAPGNIPDESIYEESPTEVGREMPRWHWSAD